MYLPKVYKKFQDRFLVDSLLYIEKMLNENLQKHMKFKLQHLLRWEDKSAMAFSIETRVPFLDHNLVAYTLALPSSTKIQNGVTKWVLKEALKDLVPSSISKRTDKIGFASPEEYWIGGEKLEMITDLENSPHPLLRKYVNLRRLRELSVNHKNLTSKQSRVLFRVLCLDNWLKTFFTHENIS